jgi:hypothetical protein
MASSFRKQQLIDELAEARQEISEHTGLVRDDVAVGRKFKRGVSEHPASWLGGAAFLGLLISSFAFRQKAPFKPGTNGHAPQKSAFSLPLLKFALGSATPAIATWLKRRIDGFRRR